MAAGQKGNGRLVVTGVWSSVRRRRDGIGQTQRTEPELKKALQEKPGVKTVELDIAALSSRELIGRLLSELGGQANYREHRFPAARGSAQDRLVVTAWGFLLPNRSLFVTDREIPLSLHRFFFDKGLEIVYFQ